MDRIDNRKETSKKKNNRVYLCFPFYHPTYGQFPYFVKAISFLYSRGIVPIVSTSYFLDQTTLGKEKEIEAIQKTIETCDSLAICTPGWGFEGAHLMERQFIEIHHARRIDIHVFRLPCL